MITRIGLFALLVLSGCAPQSAEQPAPRSIIGEVVALYGENERLLLWKHIGVTGLYAFAADGTRVDYTEGVDYVVTTNGVARTSDSAIYDFSSYTVANNPGGTFTWVDDPRNPPYTRFQHTYVDYNSRTPNEVIAALSPAPIRGRVMAAGDSITAGANTISLDALGTDADSYVGLLRNHFAGQFVVENFSEAGTGLSYLTSALPAILADDRPEVFIIAFGMNDHSNGLGYLPNFKAELVSNANQINAAGSRVIFVGFPRKNNLWENYDEAAIITFNQAIKEAAAETGSAFVDIEAMFEAAKQKKTHIELFGDNFHHPGNYGQRIYFSGILPHLLSTPLDASRVPSYVTLP